MGKNTVPAFIVVTMIDHYRYMSIYIYIYTWILWNPLVINQYNGMGYD